MDISFEDFERNFINSLSEHSYLAVWVNIEGNKYEYENDDDSPADDTWEASVDLIVRSRICDAKIKCLKISLDSTEQIETILKYAQDTQIIWNGVFDETIHNLKNRLAVYKTNGAVEYLY